MRLLLLLLAAGALAAAPRAQSVYGLQGPIARVTEMTGPSVAACAYPDGPVGATFVYPQVAPCVGQPNPVAFVPGAGVAALAGDIAVNREDDIIYVTDGNGIAAYKGSTGAIMGNFGAAFLGLGAPLTGLGFDGATGWLWISDANGYAALEPNGTCAPIPRFAFQASPAGVGALSDIDVDPNTGELWVCDAAGNVSHFFAGAAVPNNIIPVAGALACGFLGMPLTGLTIDSSSPPGTFIVTDGITVARLMETGAAAFGGAPTRFALPMGCWPTPGAAGMQGLAYAAGPATYGVSAGMVLDTIGEATVPSPLFTLTLTGVPVGVFALAVDFGAACPALAAGGAPVYVPFTPMATLIGPFAGAGGPISIPAALPAPPLLPAGITVFVQALAISGGVWSSSNGLAFTTSLP